MSIVIGSNYAGQNTVRNISLIQRSISRASQRLASSLEINQAADAPAGLVISEKMRSQIGSLTQHIKNLEFNLNKANALDSAIAELRDKLTEIKTVALAASDENGATKETGRIFQAQIDDLVAAYNSQLASSDYAGQKLFGSNAGAASRVQPLAQYSVAYPEDAAKSVDMIARELAYLDTVAEAVGAESKNNYQSTVRSFQVASQNMVAAESQERDADYAAGQAEFLRQKLQLQADVAASALGSLSSDAVFKLLHA